MDKQKAIDFLQNEIVEDEAKLHGYTIYDLLDERLVDKVTEVMIKFAEQSPERVSVDAIVNCTIAEMKEIAEKASEDIEFEYNANGFFGKPRKLSVGDIRVILKAIKSVKCK